AVWNDLWEYTPSTGQWSWMSGSSAGNQWGTYGTLGVPTAENVPGGHSGAAIWTDASGNIWLFGGVGYGASGNLASLNDIWKFTPPTGEWTWEGGSSAVNQGGTYGTLGTPAVGNAPGGRGNAASWTDASGNFWLFGGRGFDGSGNGDALNDLWVY